MTMLSDGVGTAEGVVGEARIRAEAVKAKHVVRRARRARWEGRR